MDIQITGRNITVSDELRAYVEKRTVSVLEGYPRVESCHVVLTVEKYRHTAEFIVQGKDKLREMAQETTNDMYASIDAASLRLDKQLRKSREKMIARSQKRERLTDVEGELAPELGGE